MRHYDIRINENTYALDVEEIAHDTFTVHLADGQLVDVHLSDHQDLAQAQISPQIEARRPPKHAAPELPPPPSPESQAPAAHGTPASREISASRPAAPAVRRTSPSCGANAMTAPMPGVVLSVEVSPGDGVTRGQTLLVLEAMKMKNDIKAERDATVAGVHVNAGDQVKHGDLLIEFEVN